MTTTEATEFVFNAATVLSPVRRGAFPADQGRMLAKALLMQIGRGEIPSNVPLVIDTTRCRPDVLISSFFTAMRDEIPLESNFDGHDRTNEIIRAVRNARWVTCYPWQQETAEHGMMLPSACVIIVRNGKIAAIRSKKHNGSLELPGGKALRYELPETNAIRECVEEIGHVPWLRKLLFCGPCGGFMCSTYFATLPDHCELISGEEGEAGWFTPDEMLTGTYAGHTRQWVPMVFVGSEASS